MTDRFATVEIFMPGASAVRMEALVTEKVENALREIPEVKELSSTSSEGFTIIQARLHDSVGKDQVDLVWSEIRNKLVDVEPELPSQAMKPRLDVRGLAAVTLGGSDLAAQLNGKQPTLSAGSGITLAGSTISADQQLQIAMGTVVRAGVTFCEA